MNKFFAVVKSIVNTASTHLNFVKILVAVAAAFAVVGGTSSTRDRPAPNEVKTIIYGQFSTLHGVVFHVRPFRDGFYAPAGRWPDLTAVPPALVTGNQTHTNWGYFGGLPR
jgi:hypothetical protein